MNIYKIVRSNGEVEYDEYELAVVYAPSEDWAKFMRPGGKGYQYDSKEHCWFLEWKEGEKFKDNAWTSPDKVHATFIGHNSEVAEPAIILAVYRSS